MKKIRGLDAGVLTVLLFWGTVFFCAARLGGYNHLTRLVSELGAVGTPTRILFAAGLMLTGVASLIFILRLLAVCRSASLSPAPVLILFAFSFFIAGAGLFSMPLLLHNLLDMPVVLLPLKPFLAPLLWPRGKPPHLKPAAAISLALMTAGFLVYIPEILVPCIGAKQRFLHLGWSLWFIALSRSFRRPAAGTCPAP